MNSTSSTTHPYADKLSKFCLEFEEVTSEAASNPFLGVVTGVVKIIAGAFQTLIGLFSWIAVSLFNHSSSRKFWQEYIASHIVHGLGNICAGTLEAIPLIGTILYEVRQIQAEKLVSPHGHELKHNQHHRFLGYKFIELNYSHISSKRYSRNDGSFWTV